MNLTTWIYHVLYSPNLIDYKPQPLSGEIHKIIDDLFFEIENKEKEQYKITAILNEYNKRLS